MSFVKLMLENGTTLRDETHELLVYKVSAKACLDRICSVPKTPELFQIDHKKWDENSISYMTLPATKSDLAGLQNVSQGSLNSIGTLKHGSYHHAGLSLSTRDGFHIATLVCSTKFTANVDLLGLLKWRINTDNLTLTLLSLMKVDGEEVVKVRPLLPIPHPPSPGPQDSDNFSCSRSFFRIRLTHCSAY